MNVPRLRRVAGSALLAFAVFGAWAYAANFEHPERRLISAVSQGVFSFGFSLIVMSITEATFALLAGRRWQVPLAIAVPVMTSVGGASLIHLAAHTPSIVLTLLGPALIGAAYQTAYVLNLRRESAAARTHDTSDAARSRAGRRGAAESHVRG